jgi:hypothetical protein
MVTPCSIGVRAGQIDPNRFDVERPKLPALPNESSQDYDHLGLYRGPSSAASAAQRRRA